MPQAIHLASKLQKFSDHWAPRTVTTFNGLDVMVVKVLGEFSWHSHPDTDDFFLVLKGHLRIETEAGPVDLAEGDLHVVPRGMRHRPVAQEECHLLLIEPSGTPNSGDPATAAPRQWA